MPSKPPENQADRAWKPFSPNILRDPGLVQVWRIPLECREHSRQSGSFSPSALRELLSPDEREKADRFRIAKKSVEFVTVRGALRFILGRCLEMDPADLRFQYARWGKPFLENALGEKKCRFNVSHSHEMALIAISNGRELGIDIEYTRAAGPKSNTYPEDKIPERFFSSAEAAKLQSLPESARRLAFFTCWTRKEAYIKAKGEGLSIPLKDFEVSLAPDEPPQLLHVKNNPAEARRWRIKEIQPAEGYVAALAVEGHDWQLNLWQWPPD